MGNKFLLFDENYEVGHVIEYLNKSFNIKGGDKEVIEAVANWAFNHEKLEGKMLEKHMKKIVDTALSYMEQGLCVIWLASSYQTIKRRDERKG